MKNDVLHLKCKKTDQYITIKQHDIEQVDWGMTFKVDNELDAYRAAYKYNHSPHGLVVEYAPNIGMWLVTVFNATAVDVGLYGAR